MSFQFASPWWLLLLPLVVLVIRTLKRSDQGFPIRFSSLQLIKPLRPARTIRARQLLIVARAVALTLFILALARPQAGRKLTEINSEGVDIMLVIDVSGSMDAMDFTLEGGAVSRLEVVKDVVKRFIQNQNGNRLGLVVFGSCLLYTSPSPRD